MGLKQSICSNTIAMGQCTLSLEAYEGIQINGCCVELLKSSSACSIRDLFNFLREQA